MAYVKTHFHNNHLSADDFSHYEYLWMLSNFEVKEMKNIWKKRLASGKSDFDLKFLKISLLCLLTIK